MIQSFVGFIGRALLSIIFISSAVHKFMDWPGTMQYFHLALTDRLAISVGHDCVQGIVEWSIANAFALLLAGTLFELLGGLFVFLGFCTRLGSLLLIVFLISATLLFHNFWDIQGPERQMQMINFMKNVSICGGLIYILAMGKGGKRAKKPETPSSTSKPCT